MPPINDRFAHIKTGGIVIALVLFAGAIIALMPGSDAAQYAAMLVAAGVVVFALVDVTIPRLIAVGSTVGVLMNLPTFIPVLIAAGVLMVLSLPIVLGLLLSDLLETMAKRIRKTNV